MYAAATVGFGEDAEAVSSSRRAVSVISSRTCAQVLLESFLENFKSADLARFCTSSQKVSDMMYH